MVLSVLGGYFYMMDHVTIQEAILNGAMVGLAANRAKLKKIRPILDPQKLDEFTYAIQESMVNDAILAITIFNEFEDIKGKVLMIDQQIKRIKIESKNVDEVEIMWIPLNDIMQMEIVV